LKLLPEALRQAVADPHLHAGQVVIKPLAKCGAQSPKKSPGPNLGKRVVPSKHDTDTTPKRSAQLRTEITGRKDRIFHIGGLVSRRLRHCRTQVSAPEVGDRYGCKPTDISARHGNEVAVPTRI
jgi:hypothetical protein